MSTFATCVEMVFGVGFFIFERGSLLALYAEGRSFEFLPGWWCKQ